MFLALHGSRELMSNLKELFELSIFNQTSLDFGKHLVLVIGTFWNKDWTASVFLFSARCRTFEQTTPHIVGRSSVSGKTNIPTKLESNGENDD